MRIEELIDSASSKEGERDYTDAIKVFRRLFSDSVGDFRNVTFDEENGKAEATLLVKGIRLKIRAYQNKAGQNFLIVGARNSGLDRTPIHLFSDSYGHTAIANFAVKALSRTNRDKVLERIKNNFNNYKEDCHLKLDIETTYIELTEEEIAYVTEQYRLFCECHDSNKKLHAAIVDYRKEVAKCQEDLFAPFEIDEMVFENGILPLYRYVTPSTTGPHLSCVAEGKLFQVVSVRTPSYTIRHSITEVTPKFMQRVDLPYGEVVYISPHLNISSLKFPAPPQRSRCEF